MDPHLDVHVAAAAPPLVERTPELRQRLHELVAHTEAVAGPARPRLARRAGVVSLAAAALLSLGAGASAAGLVPAPSWAPWYDDPGAVHEQRRLSTGTTCEISYGARPFEEQAHPVSDSERAAAVSAAREFLRDVDLSTIDVHDAVRRWQASRPVLDLPPEEMPPEPTRDEVELLAVQAELNARLSAALERRGLSTHAVAVAAANRCNEETQP